MKKTTAKVIDGGEELLATFTSAAGIILAVTENRNWIEVFFDGVIMHTETVNLPAGKLFNIYVEEIAHKSTVYEHPRTMIYFDGPYNLRVTRDGERVIVTGTPNPRRELGVLNRRRNLRHRDHRVEKNSEPENSPQQGAKNAKKLAEM